MSAAAERSVLAGLMSNNAVYDDISELVSAEDFTLDLHRRLFSLIATHLERGDTVDAMTLADTYSDLDLSTLGGMVSELMSVANVPAYAKLVRKASVTRRLTEVGTEIIQLASSDESLEDKIEQAQAKVQAIESGRPNSGPVTVKTALGDFVNRLETRFESGEIVGLPTGYTDLDTLICGFQPGDLAIVAGRPAMGKTTFAMNIAEHASQTGAVLVFSLEMPTDQLMQRAVSGHGRVNFQSIRTGKVDADEWPRITNAVAKLVKRDLLIDDTGGLKIHELRSRARKAKRKHDLSLIVVDYMQLIVGKAENRTQEITQISGNLKAMAKELKVPVICLSQLNRDLEKRANKRPTMSDLRESGSIEQDGDVILFIYRDEVYNPESPMKGVAEVIIGKQRNGPTGTVQLAFHGSYCRFDNLDRGSWVKPEKPVLRRAAGFDYAAVDKT